MTDLFGRRSLHAIVREVMERMGHVAPVQEVVQAVRKVATKDEWEVAADQAMTGSIRSALRAGTDRELPEYSEVGGVYKALSLFSIEDYQEKARSYAKLGRANRDRVFQLRDACQEAHQKTFDAESILAEFGLGA